jgi:hypothetical protein
VILKAAAPLKGEKSARSTAAKIREISADEAA